jgi:endonuclease-8
MQMTGSWHLYRPGERWRVDPRAARVVLTFVDVVAVCFSAPHVRWLSPAALAHDRWLGELGEDLLDPKFALDRAVGDLRAGDDLSIGEAVMDQRRIAGVGNIYKSESLFLATLSPFAKVSALDDASLRALITTAQRLLLASVEGRRGNALLDRAGARFWAYRRAREPCLVCGAAIVMKRQGMAQRSTYWCPGCQPTPRGGA